MAHLLLSAAHKSSGKTTLTIGLCAALTVRGMHVQPFKKGPDYIDPMWLQQAAARPCYNLDFYTMQHDEITQLFESNNQSAEISLIEGNKGLYDGLDLDGSNSNAALAKLLRAPVVLVIDARGMTRGIAPLILGYQNFDTHINIAGIIINQLGGLRHESKLRAVIEHYTDVPVIGAVYQNPQLQMVERHLGLIPSNEASQASKKINTIGNIIAEQVDLDKLIGIANTAETFAQSNLSIIKNPSKTSLNNNVKKVIIGIIQDAAFGFYYQDDLQALKNAGAELVTIDSLHDASLPHNINGLFIGGGFPETHMPELSANMSLRANIKTAITHGLPVYAECGGLMYLTRSICWNNKTFEMVGAIDAETVMENKPQGRGYVQLEATPDHPWKDTRKTSLGHTTLSNTSVGKTSTENLISAHEFHYSRLDKLNHDGRFAFKVLRGAGITGNNDGIILHNTLACYAHMRHSNNNPWAIRFIQHVNRCFYNFS